MMVNFAFCQEVSFDHTTRKPVTKLTKLCGCSDFIFHAVITRAGRPDPCRYLLRTDVSCNYQSYSDNTLSAVELPFFVETRKTLFCVSVCDRTLYYFVREVLMCVLIENKINNEFKKGMDSTICR